MCLRILSQMHKHNTVSRADALLKQVTFMHAPHKEDEGLNEGLKKIRWWREPRGAAQFYRRSKPGLRVELVSTFTWLDSMHQKRD